MKVIRILHLDDSPLDAELILGKLKAELPCEVQWVGGREDYKAALKSGGFDIVLCDYKFPAYDGASGIKAAHKHKLPVVIVTGSLTDDQAVECLKEGAVAYVTKHRLYLLAPAVKSALKLDAE